MPRAGCRAVAHTFNRLHPGVSVGKTFVADLIASHQQEIADLRRQIRSAKPRTVQVNDTWAMDMTFFTDHHKTTHAAIGIIDHGSRVALRLQVLTRRCSWSMLGHLCLAIAQHGKPRKLRTDNEAVLNSGLFNTRGHSAPNHPETRPLAKRQDRALAWHAQAAAQATRHPKWWGAASCIR